MASEREEELARRWWPVARAAAEKYVGKLRAAGVAVDEDEYISDAGLAMAGMIREAIRDSRRFPAAEGEDSFARRLRYAVLVACRRRWRMRRLYTVSLDDESAEFLRRLAAGSPADGESPELLETLRAAMSRLSGRERLVVVRRLDGLSYEAIGAELHVTRERVRQVFEKARRKILIYLGRPR